MKESYPNYKAKFQQYAPRLGWDEQAIMVAFRRELSNDIKDEIMRIAAPASFAAIIKQTAGIASVLREKKQ